jgi:hypothetical protein
MNRSGIAVLIASVLACGGGDAPDRDVEISPSDLYRAFAEDSAGAAERFAGATLVISGRPSAVFSGAPPGSSPAFTFTVDPGGTVHGSGEGLVHLLQDAAEGRPVTLACPASEARFWPAPNESLELFDCEPRIAPPAG